MSVYDLARQSFPGMISLREHFRCVPEIIQFSNNLSYNNKIQPLRDASLVITKPAVISYHVNGGIREGDTNQAEAKAIAALIAGITEQPEYKEKSIGVVTLLGDEQALCIEALLLKHLSPSEFVKRKIICGNPAQFQGDERDIIFLSTVNVAENGFLPMMDGEGHNGRDKKRYNVAASRARDQMWVVHSLDPDADLKPGDLRYRLIKYAMNPQEFIKSMKLEESKTESEFEKQVLHLLRNAGYRVTPQFEVGAYRIDLVVNGKDGKRLAVECDGERFHGPEQLQDDMTRQADLERCGHIFIRIRGSLFFRDNAAAMKPVFEKLNEMGIEPIGDETIDQFRPGHEVELIERVKRRAAEIQTQWAESETSIPEIMSSSN